MNKKKIIFFLIFIFFLFIFLFFHSGEKNNSEEKNKEEPQPVLNKEEPQNEDYPRYDHEAIFYTWIGTLYFLVTSFIFGAFLTFIIFIFFNKSHVVDNSSNLVGPLLTCFLAFLFYSFIFPVFIAFGNYKNWVRFYSPLNITIMVFLLFIIATLLCLKKKYYA